MVAKREGWIFNRLAARKAFSEHESGWAKIHGHECQFVILSVRMYREASPSKNTSVHGGRLTKGLNFLFHCRKEGEKGIASLQQHHPVASETGSRSSQANRKHTRAGTQRLHLRVLWLIYGLGCRVRCNKSIASMPAYCMCFSISI